ncbi:ankyrin repeat domain-containing protein [Kocuria koreensis]|uniref:Ankyrin repeat domain-containing protein n=1 Tax=Rothia koreensis TaxID=592378 RepID=A0A7K1LJ36_9MICC|nr:ankyrin repeat domain-containing protein [Rothia koreensis]MUN55120.1 ankyrin repeat domain-containing protein [Rothia koreensis]
MTDSSDNASELSDQELEALHQIFDLAREGQTQQLAAVLDQGVPVNLTDPKGDTLLILGAYREHPDVVALLLERGADVDRLNDRGQTALASAIFRNNREIADALLDAGADPSLGSQSAGAIAEFFDIDDMKALLRERGIL